MRTLCCVLVLLSLPAYGAVVVEHKSDTVSQDGMPPVDGVIEDRVEILELNHFYAEDGRHIFDQIIGWEFDRFTTRIQVVFWKLHKPENPLPGRGGYNREFVWLFWDGDYLRRVRSKAFKETWTQYNPEMRERSFLPTDDRRGLTKPRKLND